jgi:hypothetical protein
MPGTGSAISFGTMTATGTYSVQATLTSAPFCVNAMAGNTVVSVNATPAVYSVTAPATSYCAGGTGIAVGLSASQSGVNYQLYNGSTPSGSPVSGTGGAITFGNKTAAGTYTVQAVNATTSCSANMSSSASISINPTPTVFAVSGGGNYCSGGSGVAIGLTGSSTGVNYQLYNSTGGAIGSPAAGTGSSFNFPGTTTTAGAYTVLATIPSTGCTSAMAGSATVSINAVPAVQLMTGGGTYCAGGAGQPIGLSNSASGVTYQLFNGSTPGMSISGTGSSISFGLQTATGTYSVLATNGVGCTTPMSGTATISTNPLPNVYTLSGGGSYCNGGTGVSMVLGGSNTGVSYQLYNSGLASGTSVSGTGGALTFSGLTAAGSYYVVATNGTSCTANMAGTANVSINPLPTQYTVTGGGSYCSGGTGVDIGLSGSSSGVSYQLYNGSTAIGAITAGTGLPLDFGLKTAGGNYSVIAINTTTSCTNNMLGTPNITVNSLPTPFNVTGGGGYCNGGSGVSIGLDNSASGVSYQLYNGGGASGSPVIGGSGSINFGTFTGAGTYTVLATNTSTSCTNAMSGNAVVSINPLPGVYNVTGGGTMCNGGSGVNVNLNSSAIGVSYQLYNGATPAGSPVAGTGGVISFGPQTAAGNYTAVAVNGTTGCQRNMAGSANVFVNSLPTAYPVSGGGAYCGGDAGVAVGLGNSATGVNYTLYNGSTVVGSAVMGTGGAITFGLQTAPGTYNVIGTSTSTGCSNAMTGTTTISVSALPTAYTLSGGGNMCNGALGLPIVLSGSATGISYQLMNGSATVGSAINGTGAPINFGLFTTGGTYAVVATNTTSGCTNNMSGNPVINVNPLPTAYLMTGGGSFCNGDAGMPVGLSGSNSGISYQLYNGGTLVGSPMAGNGGALSFGNQTVAGSYMVVATNTTTGCTNNMSGTSTITVNPQPTSYAVTGGGTICANAPGISVGLANSTAGVSYQLYNGLTPAGSAVIGVGGPLDFGPMTTAGSYNVMATNTSGCSRSMSGSATINVNPVPAVQTVGGGGNICAGSTGTAVTLGSSNTGVTYQLYNGATSTGGSVAGTGSAISFGLQTAAGTYTVLATMSGTGCTNAMGGSATVNVNNLPNAYAVLGMGSSYCEGGAGVHILLSNSDPGVDYQLMNGATPVGATFPGTGSGIDFGAMTAAGIYKVFATNGATGCSSYMSGTAPLQINPLPTAYAVTGGGNYCTGTTGSPVGLGGSNSGISYQLYRNGTATGSPVAGNGGAISFGNQLGTGTYMVIATNNATTCTNNMTGSVNIGINALPAVYTVSGGGTICNGATGAPVGLLGSATGISYQLYNAGVTAGSAVAGTGGAISFGPQTAAGNYSVVATNSTTGCTNNMSGSVSVIVNALPAAHAVTGSGSYCAGGSGLAVGLDGSNTGVTYQMMNGSTPVGATVTGGSGAISFGPQTAGTYMVVATSTANGCTSNMTDSAVITASALPTAYNVTGGGTYCTSATAAGMPVGLSGSANGVNYTLWRNGTENVATVAGSGSAISFGNHTDAGNYTVVANSSTSTCSNNMNGSATIAVAPTVTPAVGLSSGVADNAVCLGVLVTFTANPVNGGTSPAYQWTVNGNPVGLGYSTYSYVPHDGDVVGVTLTSNAACASTATASNTVAMSVSSHQMPEAKVTVTPNDTVCAGTPVIYHATASYGGANPTFTWLKNGAVVGTGATYSTIPANNDVITCRMSSDFPCRLEDTVSTDVKMTVEAAAAPGVTITANPGTYIQPGRTVTLTANVTNGVNPSFQWVLGTQMLAGATTSTYTSNNFNNDDSVSVVVANNNTCGMTAAYRSVVMKVVTTGVGTVTASQSDIRLMPNPNKGDFMLKGTTGSKDDQEMTVEVTDLLGQVVYKAKVMARGGVVNERIQISNTLANGSYILSLRSETEQSIFHFVLEQ